MFYPCLPSAPARMPSLAHTCPPAVPAVPAVPAGPLPCQGHAQLARGWIPSRPGPPHVWHGAWLLLCLHACAPAVLAQALCSCGCGCSCCAVGAMPSCRRCPCLCAPGLHPGCAGLELFARVPIFFGCAGAQGVAPQPADSRVFRAPGPPAGLCAGRAPPGSGARRRHQGRCVCEGCVWRALAEGWSGGGEMG